MSGGNLSNELLDRIDYAFLAAHPKPLFGYSDLTALLNAVHARAGAPRRTLPGPQPGPQDGARQQALFQETLARRERAVFAARILLAGERMSGPAVGGNLRCFLKLAGTGYMPDLCGKILALESLHGTPAQVLSGFCQLGQLGAFEAVSGVLLGTFTALGPGRSARTNCCAARWTGACVRTVLPVAATDRLGHGADSLARSSSAGNIRWSRRRRTARFRPHRLKAG